MSQVMVKPREMEDKDDNDEYEDDDDYGGKVYMQNEKKGK